MNQWLVQGIGFAGLVLCTVCVQFKDTKKMLLVQMTGSSLYVIQFILLGAYSGCVNLTISVFNFLLLCLEQKDHRAWQGWKWLIALAILISNLLTWKNLFSLFPCAASVVSVFLYWSRNGKTIRLGKLLFTGPCWLIYDLYVQTWAGILTELLGLGSILISIRRHGLRNLDQTD